ncbi:MAG: DUF5666 domain-containing protein [Acidobacteriota bacterium]|nr:DUF5666 domain-containing protein [Acidobacteriota bacterium]
MKKVFALSLVAVFCLAAVAVAGGDKLAGKTKPNEGTISKLDTTAKTMTVKDSAGKETAVYWNDATKVEGGELKEGSLVHYKGAEKDGKLWATWVHVGEMKKM